MENETILMIIERMQREREIKNSSISAHIHMKMGGGAIEDVYKLLSSDNIEILLRSVVKQHQRFAYNQELLKLNIFDEIVKAKSLEDNMLIKLFKACMLKKQKHEDACKVFIKTCDLLYN